MLLILLLKFNQLTIRTRLMAGLSVGLILFTSIFLSYYGFFCYDSQTRFASKNTRIYLQLDNGNTKENFYSIKATDTILQAFGLADLDRRLIGRKITVLCDHYSEDTACALIIKTENKPLVRKYLADKRLAYKEIGLKTIIISRQENWLKTVKKTINPLIYLKYQSAIGQSGSLTAIFNVPTTLNSEITKVIYLSNIAKFTKFSGSITDKGILIRPADRLNVFSFAKDQPLKDDSTIDACDLTLKAENGSQARLLNDYIIQLFAGKIMTPTPFIINQPFNLCLNKTGSTGNLLTDYDIIIQSSQQLNTENSQILEKILLNLASYYQPSEKTFYLNDGTRIAELWPQPDKLTFDSTSEIKSIKLTASRSLFYTNNSTGLLVGNKIGLIMPNISNKPNNYLSIRINSLPDSQIKELFADFSYLTATNDQIIIR